MARNDLVRVRSEFRTREDGTLPTGTCGECGKVVYAVETGAWLHWGTLVEQCGKEDRPIGASKPRQGPKLAPAGVDTPERGLARAGLSATYRRPSWEWMGCR